MTTQRMRELYRLAVRAELRARAQYKAAYDASFWSPITWEEVEYARHRAEAWGSIVRSAWDRAAVKTEDGRYVV